MVMSDGLNMSSHSSKENLRALLLAGLENAAVCLDDLRFLGLDGVHASPRTLEILSEWGKGGKPGHFPELIKKVASCSHCGLPAAVRGKLLHPPPGSVRVLFVDEMPDRAALREGSAMGGEAGALLWKIVGAMKLNPDAVYVTHTRMCRLSPGQTSPSYASLPCRAFLSDVIRLLRPEVICALGERAGQLLSGENLPLHSLRGRFLSFESLPLMITHHPADMLKDPGLKRDTWEDVRKVMEFLAL
ncbi:hypothetical protein FIM25_13700 [Desulfobotulus mexicanus]|uniref:Uracil-DNA glycosylase-like domain-containing protein n=2 Tax=Desulfobotulus mexicanus TaxID=2586642 RepID=A0A5S5MDC1_9BACT|nr:hypothetical protein FIM25_13700 [Desulfobotulus mexicanus]